MMVARSFPGGIELKPSQKFKFGKTMYELLQIFNGEYQEEVDQKDILNLDAYPKHIQSYTET